MVKSLNFTTGWKKPFPDTTVRLCPDAILPGDAGLARGMELRLSVPSHTETSCWECLLRKHPGECIKKGGHTTPVTEDLSIIERKKQGVQQDSWNRALRAEGKGCFWQSPRKAATPYLIVGGRCSS